jgi:hypothetical protein
MPSDRAVTGAIDNVEFHDPPFTSFRDIGLQQYPRLQQPLRWALSFPNQRFKPFAFLAAQPHNIFLYRNLLAAMIASLASSATKANHQILSSWLKRATSWQVQVRLIATTADTQ